MWRGILVILGILGAALPGGTAAYAQDTGSRYWVNPVFTESPPAVEMSLDRGEEIELPYTLTGYAGVVGRVELGRVTLDHRSDGRYSSFDIISPRETVSGADIQWNITPRISVASGFRREEADPRLGLGTYTEDTFGGGVALTITPRLSVSASGSLSMRSGAGEEGSTGLTGDAARLGAAYSFLPNVRGSLNYTYESYDGGEGTLDEEGESTVSVSVTGSF